MQPPLVYTVIVNWNRLNDTLECLDSLTHQTYQNHKLVAVDNASPDEGYKVIAERFPQVEQVLNPRNLGFTGGYNAGIRRALELGADFVFVLNNDTFLASDVIELLVKASAPDDVGIVSPMIYFASEPEKIWSAGGKVSPYTLEITDHHGRDSQFTGITERDFLSGCAMLIKRSALEKVGMFDDRFFWYYEDSDLSLRYFRSKYRLLLVPQAKMWHKVSSSSGGSDSPTERYYMARSSIRFYRKHAHLWQLPFIFFWRSGSALITGVRLIRRRRWDSLGAYLRGLRDGFKRIPLPG